MTRAERVEKYRIWLKALRSGKFKQSRGCYHGKKGGHCCLGVGQIVLGLPKEETSKRLGEVLGLTWKPKDVSCGLQYLINLNDDGHRNFKYIAAKIEEKILPRFLTKA